MVKIDAVLKQLKKVKKLPYGEMTRQQRRAVMRVFIETRKMQLATRVER